MDRQTGAWLALVGEIAWLVLSTALFIVLLLSAPNRLWTLVALAVLVLNTVRVGASVRQAYRRLEAARSGP